jgi:hypothetical protein
MSPFYVPDRTALTPGDAARAAALYPLEGPMAELFALLDTDRDGRLSRAEFLRATTGAGRAPMAVRTRVQRGCALARPSELRLTPLRTLPRSAARRRSCSTARRRAASP